MKKKTLKEIYLLLRYDDNDKCLVDSVYNNREHAENIKERYNTRTKEPISFHVIKKKVRFKK